MKRENGTLRNKIVKCCDEPGLTWPKALPNVLMHIRERVKVKVVSAHLRFNRKLPKPEDNEGMAYLPCFIILSRVEDVLVRSCRGTRRLDRADRSEWRMNPTDTSHRRCAAETTVQIIKRTLQLPGREPVTADFDLR